MSRNEVGPVEFLPVRRSIITDPAVTKCNEGVEGGFRRVYWEDVVLEKVEPWEFPVRRSVIDEETPQCLPI